MMLHTPVFESAIEVSSGGTVDITEGLISYIPLASDAVDDVTTQTYTPTSTVTYDGLSSYFSGGATELTGVPRMPLLSDSMSVSVWINPVDLSASAWILSSRSSTSNSSAEFQIYSYANNFEITLAEGSDVLASYSNTIIDTSYNDIYTLHTFTYDGVTFKVYENDVLVFTQNVAMSMNTASENTTIGGAGFTSSLGFVGSISKVRGYNIPITQEVVSEIFNSEKADYGITDNLITNGTFDTDVSGWSTEQTGATLSWTVNGALVETDGYNAFLVPLNVVVEDGESYLLTFTNEALSASKFSSRVDGTFLNAATSSFGTFSHTIIASGTSMSIDLITYTPESVYWRDVSIVKIS